MPAESYVEGTVITAEGEGMAQPTPTRLATMTGSTDIALSDGTIRAAPLGILSGLLFFAHIEFGLLSSDGIVALEAALVPGGVFAWAIFDRFIKARLPA